MSYNFFVDKTRTIKITGGPNGDEEISYRNVLNSLLNTYNGERFTSTASSGLIGYQSKFAGSFVISNPQYVYPVINGNYAIDDKAIINSANPFVYTKGTGGGLVFRKDNTYCVVDAFSPDILNLGRHSAFPVASLASPGTYSQSAIYHRLLPFADSTTTITTDWRGYIKEDSLEYNRDLDENHSGIYFLHSNSNTGLVKSTNSLVIGSPVFSVDPALSGTEFGEPAILRIPSNDNDDNYATTDIFATAGGFEYNIYRYRKLSHDLTGKSFGIYLIWFLGAINLTDFKPQWASVGVNYYIILQGDADLSDYENIKNLNIYYTITPITEDYTKTFNLQNAAGNAVFLKIYGFTQEDNNQEKHGVLMCNYMSLHDIKIPEV